jgi:hypothetical protein
VLPVLPHLTSQLAGELQIINRALQQQLSHVELLLVSPFSQPIDHGLGIEIALWAVETGGVTQRRAVAYHITERRPMRRTYVPDCDDHGDYATVACGHFCCGGSTAGSQSREVRSESKMPKKSS